MNIGRFILCSLLLGCAVTEVSAGISINELKSKIDAGGTYYDVSVLPGSFAEMKNVLYNVMAENIPEDVPAEFLPALESIINGGFFDLEGTAASSILISGSEKNGDPVYRNKLYLAFKENTQAWMRNAVFYCNSDFSALYALMPETVLAAISANCDAAAVEPFLKICGADIDATCLQETVKIKGSVMICLFAGAEDMYAFAVLPPDSLPVDGNFEEADDYIVVPAENCQLFFTDKAAAEAWKDAEKIQTLPAVDISDAAGFWYIAEDITEMLIKYCDTGSEFAGYSDFAVPFNEARFGTVAVEDGGNLYFTEISHSDTLLLLSNFCSMGIAAAMNSADDYDCECFGETYFCDKFAEYLLTEETFPAEDDAEVLAGIFGGKNGIDFVYLHPGAEEGVVPVCITAPVDGFCRVIYSDGSTMIVEYNEYSRSAGIIARIKPESSMSEAFFREWLSALERSCF